MSKNNEKTGLVCALLISFSVMIGLIIIWDDALKTLILVGAFLICIICCLYLSKEDKNVKKHN